MATINTQARRLIRQIQDHPLIGRLTDQLSSKVNSLVESSDTARRIDHALHGAWLGHPLHPPLTDVPIGAWSVAAITDAATLGRRRPHPFATCSIALGVLAAVPTALSGLADWRALGPSGKRLGTAHALLNSTALVFYALALVARLAGGPGRLLAFGGFGASLASAYLGGHLVYESHAGIKHVSDAYPPSEAKPVPAAVGLSEGELRRVEVEGFPIVLARQDGRTYALADVCPHLGCSLAEGSLAGTTLVCPCHGSTFELADGRVVAGPSAYDVDSFSVRESDGQVVVEPRPE